MSKVLIQIVYCFRKRYLPNCSVCLIPDAEASALGEVEVDLQIQQIYKWGQGGARGGR